ncbi:MAG: hypothetical protein GY722_08750, partial [bacterium]|nr:hypothetical protein [bacterium]
EPDPDAWDSVLEALFATPADVAGGFSAVAVTDDYETWVDVFVLTNGGSMRGFPTLANELIYLWTGREGHSVAVGDSTAYRATIDDREWLVWNSDTHTFILIGPRAASVSVLESIIAGQSPYMWQQGDCLEFRDFNDELPFSPFGDYGLRHCSHGHEYEVLYSEQLTEGPDEPYPDDIGKQANRACGQRFLDQVGVYPLDSNVGLVSYLPTADEWERGARYVACVIYLEDAAGPLTLDSRFDTSTADTNVTRAEGDCLAGMFKVPCTDPHNAEVTAVGEYDAPQDAEYPDFADVFDDLDGICEVALDEYEPTDGDAEVQSFALSDMALAWDAGVRRYYCVGATLDDGWPIDTIGSLEGDWEIAPEQFDA